MNKEEALNVLIANACCEYINLCEKCPLKDTKDCEDTSFLDVLEEAIDVMLEDK